MELKVLVKKAEGGIEKMQCEISKELSYQECRELVYQYFLAMARCRGKIASDPRDAIIKDPRDEALLNDFCTQIINWGYKIIRNKTQGG